MEKSVDLFLASKFGNFFLQKDLGEKLAWIERSCFQTTISGLDAASLVINKPETRRLTSETEHYAFKYLS